MWCRGAYSKQDRSVHQTSPDILRQEPLVGKLDSQQFQDLATEFRLQADVRVYMCTDFSASMLLGILVACNN